MIPPAGVALENDSPVLHASIALWDQIRAAREDIERGRRMPMDLVAAMKDAGIFAMPMPRQWGGPELDPLTQLRVIEALAMADGSVGWCAMIGCDGGYGTAMLDQAVARAMYPDIYVATGGATTPTGTATLTKHGYRVSGRFPFVSGVDHCQWIWLGCVVTEDGTPRLNEQGTPETRQCFVRPADCEILDTWYTNRLARHRK
jgi:indole-3-acetate monooxygenase